MILVNPTRYLGNLLLAGGLIQSFHDLCRARGKELRVVLDEEFRELLEGALPAGVMMFYPRRRIRRGNAWETARAYLGCLMSIRRYGADLAFNIEEDSVSHRLTQLSAARCKIGCSPGRHRLGYTHVVPVAFSGGKHRWEGFQEVFAALGMSRPEPAYIRLPPPSMGEELRVRLTGLGVDFSRPRIVLHAGATKDYKRWPPVHFAQLARLILDQGLQPLLIGAGAVDAAINAEIQRQLHHWGCRGQVDLCDRLSLGELAAVLQSALAMAGNDSGPMHLAAALGVPGVVIFGPTEIDIWRPLGNHVRVMHGRRHCLAECTRHDCPVNYRCLALLSPEDVLDTIQTVLSREPITMVEKDDFK